MKQTAIKRIAIGKNAPFEEARGEVTEVYSDHFDVKLDDAREGSVYNPDLSIHAVKGEKMDFIVCGNTPFNLLILAIDSAEKYFKKASAEVVKIFPDGVAIAAPAPVGKVAFLPFENYPIQDISEGAEVIVTYNPISHKDMIVYDIDYDQTPK